MRNNGKLPIIKAIKLKCFAEIAKDFEPYRFRLELDSCLFCNKIMIVNLVDYFLFFSFQAIINILWCSSLSFFSIFFINNETTLLLI